MAGRSLHIGLNHVSPAAYAGWEGWLAGCIADAEDLSALCEARGFAQRTTLHDWAAAIAPVRDAIRELAANSVEGDIAVISYSGHGGQIPDVDGEEDDVLDETWCLWDGQLLDDEISLLLAEFRAGVRVVVISDSCHSGTILREQPPAGAVARLMPRAAALATYETHREHYDARRAFIGQGMNPAPGAAIISLSGCHDEQLSMDGPENGAFTGALLRVWDQGRFEGNWHRFHKAIVSRMPQSQTPQKSRIGAHWPAFLHQPPFEVAPPG